MSARAVTSFARRIAGPNVFHIVPSYAMRADALAQYLIWKRWSRWFLIKGTAADDEAYAAAVKRAAKRFGGRVVEERTYKFEAGQRRTDSGHQQIQTQMPELTQGAEAHDVIWVVDVGEAFGDYLLFRTYEPDPVVGTHGLVAVAWHRSYEQYAGTQLQNAFEEFAHRIMTERDYASWLAMRVFGEAATRTAKTDFAVATRVYSVGQVQGGWLQRSANDLPPLGPPAASTGPDRRASRPRVDVAARRISA